MDMKCGNDVGPVPIGMTKASGGALQASPGGKAPAADLTAPVDGFPQVRTRDSHMMSVPEIEQFIDTTCMSSANGTIVMDSMSDFTVPLNRPGHMYPDWIMCNESNEQPASNQELCSMRLAQAQLEGILKFLTPVKKWVSDSDTSLDNIRAEIKMLGARIEKLHYATQKLGQAEKKLARDKLSALSQRDEMRSVFFSLYPLFCCSISAEHRKILGL